MELGPTIAAGYYGTKQAQQDLDTGLLKQEQIRAQTDELAALAQERAALANNYNADAETKRGNLRAAQEKLTLMRQLWNMGGEQMGPPQDGGTQIHIGPQDPADMLQAQFEQRQQYASRLAQAGLFDESAAVLKDVGEGFHKIGQVRAEGALRRQRLEETADKRLARVNQILLSATDQPSFDRAKFMLMAQNPNEPIPAWMNLPYEQAKPFIDQFNTSSAEAAKDRQIRSEIDKNRAIEAEQNALARLNKARASLEELELAVQRDRDAALRKNGELPESVKRNPSKTGQPGQSGPKISAIERMNADQMIRAGNEVYTGFDEILKLGPQGMGAFSDVAYTKDPTFIGGMKRWLGNSITADEEHMYAARLAGVNVAAAIIASGGRAPRVSQMEAEQAAIASLKGQTRRVFFDKIHQATLKAIRGVEITRAGDEQQQQHLTTIMDRLKEIEASTAKALKITSNYAEPSSGASKPTQQKSGNATPALPPGFTVDK